MTLLNLDQKTAQHAQQIIVEAQKVGQPKEIENLITKTLGVLQEQGVYACMLFLFSRTGEKEIACRVRAQLYALLEHLPVLNDVSDRQGKGGIPEPTANAQTALQFYSEAICDDLDILLLVKELYEQTLIYARYGAKAANKEGEIP